MKKQISAKYSGSAQRGVALLFALGILSVLMVLGLAFVSNALIAQKISVNNSNRSQAEVMSQSAINRVLASLKLFSEDVLFEKFTGALVDEQLVSRAAASDVFDPSSAKSVGLLWGDLADVNSVLGGSYNAKPFAVGAGAPEWHLVYDSNGQVIGRYAYSVLSYDLFPLIDFTTAHVNITGPPAIAANGITPKQIGHDVLVGTDNWYDQFGFATAVPLDVVWRSFSQIFTRTKLTASDKQKLVRQMYEVNFPPMIEAFLASDGLFYHRFNIFRNNEDCYWKDTVNNKIITVDDLLSNNSVLYYNVISNVRSINKPEAATPSSTKEPNKALPFLACIGSDKATFADLTIRRKQIAANLIDYCINDNANGPTCDPSVSQPWTLDSNLTYTGNMQTDYIYELGFEIDLLKSNSSVYNDNGFSIDPNTPAANHDIKFALGILPTVKLVKMYKATPQSYKFSNSLDNIGVVGKVKKCTIEVIYMDNTLPMAVQQTASLQFDVSGNNIEINQTWSSTIKPNNPMDINISTPATAERYKVKSATDYNNGGMKTADSAKITIPTATIASLANVQAQRSDATSIVSTKLTSIDEIEFSNVSVTVKNMLLSNSDGSIGVDFVKGPLNELKSASTLTLVKDTSDPEKTYKFAIGSVKGIDPRQNLNVDDWYTQTPTVTKTLNASTNRLDMHLVMDIDYDTTNSIYVGKCNTNTGASPENPSNPDYDREEVTEPGYFSDTQMISTAKFPDFPNATDFNDRSKNIHTMKSPAELGRIHRGAKWETINLANKAYRDTTAINVAAIAGSLDTAGTTYANGDGGILDMIKSIDYANVSTPDEKYYTYGKIDLNMVDNTNAGRTTVDKALPGDYMYANWLYRVVDNADITKMVLNLNKPDTNRMFKSRSQVLSLSYNSGEYFYNAWGNSTPINKEEMDAYAGDLVNLAEANSIPMVFKAIIKAQSVKDLGPDRASLTGPYPTAITITKMINGTATPVSIQKGRFDEQGDDITGEVSYLVTIVRHPATNQFFVVDKVQITE